MGEHRSNIHAIPSFVESVHAGSHWCWVILPGAEVEMSPDSSNVLGENA